ncbi:hypothetical protein [Marinobacter salarius]|uniref:hypothetical protein n=1 Tax=Marinobacter salarius TaxID=1420917 RepID=UPI00125528AD|nr:hypothetical protein [Marinobacter salarius]VVT28035.1 membrane hypothetical protein [Marinobacter salarius]
MMEVIFTVVIAAWVAVSMLALPLAGQRHGFSKVAVFAMAAVSNLGTAVAAYLVLEPNPVAAAILACVALEIGLFTARRVSGCLSARVPG